MELDKLIEQITADVAAQLSAEENVKNAAELAASLEYSMLNPDTTRAQILDALKVAKDLRIANVCVSPYYTSLAAEYLRDTGVAVCVPVGFPHGAASTAAKVAEIREAIQNGATELDVEMNLLAIKSGCYADAKKDLAALCDMAAGRAKLKAIYEQGLLNDEEKVCALRLAVECGADFIKISNALTGKKACVEDIAFVRSVIGRRMGIKIDGGVRSARMASELLCAGANRFGVSRPADVLAGAGK